MTHDEIVRVEIRVSPMTLAVGDQVTLHRQDGCRDTCLVTGIDRSGSGLSIDACGVPERLLIWTMHDR